MTGERMTPQMCRYSKLAMIAGQHRVALTRRASKMSFCLFLATIAFGWTANARGLHHEILAFYYDWYGNLSTSGRWVHWKNVRPADEQIENSTDFPEYGAYDSHDVALIERQVAAARGAGITGFIASWWGQHSFEDQGMSLLMDAAAKNGLFVSTYYEKVDGQDTSSAINSAVSDLDYLLREYGSKSAWLRAYGKPVIFIYARALSSLSPAGWAEVIKKVSSDNSNGVLLIPDSLSPDYISVFDGASVYNITGQIQHKSPGEIAAWAHVAYPKMVQAAQGKISTATVIPGYDDTRLGRSMPRPITDRYGGETYRVLLSEALSARPDWILITSWNEWHEGSELEPSVQYGSTILSETKPFARQFMTDKRVK